jgi:glutamyl-tRNA reductase
LKRNQNPKNLLLYFIITLKQPNIFKQGAHQEIPHKSRSQKNLIQQFTLKALRRLSRNQNLSAYLSIFTAVNTEIYVKTITLKFTKEANLRFHHAKTSLTAQDLVVSTSIIKRSDCLV